MRVVDAILLALRVGGLNAFNYTRTTIQLITASFLLTWLLGMLLPWILQTPTPAWIAAAVCGIIWFIVIGRVTLVAWLVQLIPEQWLAKGGFSVEAFTPGKALYVLATAGMWSIASLLVLGIFPFWKSNLYWALWALMVAVCFVVATSEGDIRFWRKVYGWSLAGIAASMFAILLFPAQVSLLQSYFDRQAMYAEAEKSFHDDMRSKSQVTLTGVDQALATLIDERRLAQQAGTSWPPEKEAKLQQLSSLHNTVVREADIPIGKADKLQVSDEQLKNWRQRLRSRTLLPILAFALVGLGVALMVTRKGGSHAA